MDDIVGLFAVGMIVMGLIIVCRSLPGSVPVEDNEFDYDEVHYP
jgi:hypothetical protein